MRVSVERIGKKRLNLRTTVLARRQRDAVYDDQLSHRAGWPGVTIGRRRAAGSGEPALGDLPLVSGRRHGVILSQTWESERLAPLSIINAVGTTTSDDDR